MNILVTGITGFVGKHLEQVLIANDYRVTGLVRSKVTKIILDKDDIRVILDLLGTTKERKRPKLASRTLTSICNLSTLFTFNETY